MQIIVVFTSQMHFNYILQVLSIVEHRFLFILATEIIKNNIYWIRQWIWLGKNIRIICCQIMLKHWPEWMRRVIEAIRTDRLNKCLQRTRLAKYQLRLLFKFGNFKLASHPFTPSIHPPTVKAQFVSFSTG